MPKLVTKKFDPLEHWLYFVQERENVRLKKEAGEPKPWTSDPVLRAYRFCNMRRMDDTVSKWLLDNWYTPYYNHPNMLVAVALARFFNKPESLAKITQLVLGKEYLPEAVKATMRKLRKDGMVIWNNAYMVRGNDGVDKVESVVDFNVNPLLKIQDTLPRDTMESAWQKISASYGFGSFMAGQVSADLRWAIGASTDWADKNYWAPIGPGSKRGMNRIHGRDLKFNLNQEQFDEELEGLINIAHSRLPKLMTSRMEAIDWQNSLCELDKHCRVFLKEAGRPKQKYQGV